jgi:hypothetical protein
MIPHLGFYPLVLFGLLWLFILLCYAWFNGGVRGGQKLAQPLKTSRQRARGPKPFAGLTSKPP